MRENWYKWVLAIIVIGSVWYHNFMDVDILFDFNCPDENFKIRIDDDGQTAYAYVMKNDEICGDVWLYNRCETPAEPQWTSPDNLPCPNSAEYVNEESYSILPVEEDDFDIDYDLDKDSNLVRAYIYIKGKLIASIAEGDEPGYSNLVSKSGPIAKNLRDGIPQESINFRFPQVQDEDLE